MILLPLYSQQFETLYWETVNSKINKDVQIEIICSCKRFLPDDFFSVNKDDSFKQLILAPYKKLKDAVSYIEEHKYTFIEECFDITEGMKPLFKDVYQEIYDAYGNVANSQKDNTTMRVRIVEKTGLTVCPYCNRDYINYRAKNVSGAQLDHFFSRSDFPLFAVSLYNLIPVCGNCNRIKNNQSLSFASPFDNEIKWNEDLTFTYNLLSTNQIDIIINVKGDLKNNIKSLRIEEAYKIHDQEVQELIEKKQMYNTTQRVEFQRVFKKIGVSEAELKKLIFGPEITKESMKTKSLGKMMYDLHKELGIYD